MIAIRSEACRKILRIAVPFVLLPALAIIGTAAFKGSRYMIISLFAAVFALLLFAAGYEKRNVGTKKMIISAVMTALCFTGRFIPLFKPVAALTIITALYLGSESGFLVGSMAALISNFYFGQGPWTPFEMLGWGIVGYTAGIFSSPLKKSRILLAAYGVAAGLIYSLIMDVWSVLWYAGEITPRLYLASVISAVPYTLLYAASNAFYLYFLAKPLGTKLNRLVIKAGI